jgi:hypothetical protein
MTQRKKWRNGGKFVIVKKKRKKGIKMAYTVINIDQGGMLIFE